MILRPFDPWSSQLCTCPSKLSLNPYTGCPHGCLYCYASSYIPRFSSCRPKPDLLRLLEKETRRIPSGSVIAMSSSSDPYPTIEGELELSRGCLRILQARGLQVLVVTKSDLVARDADLLAEMRAVVSITITTLKDRLSRRLEPGAPLPGRRLEALRRLGYLGIPVAARIDPIIPGINDGEIEELVSAACSAGVKHITSSTYKARHEGMRRISQAFPERSDALHALIGAGDRRAGYIYLPEEVRRGLMERARRSALDGGVSFAACREGIAIDPGICCDGSHLLPGRGEDCI